MEKISSSLIDLSKKGFSSETNIYLGNYFFKSYTPNSILSKFEYYRMDFFPTGTIRHTNDSIKMLFSMFLILRTLISSILLQPQLVFEDLEIDKEQTE